MQRDETISPIDLEIIRNALVAAAEEMSVTIWRTSRSSVVREILDYSTAVFDADGLSVAQAARMPVHLNSMASGLSDILRDHIPLDQWRDGDVIMTNDPYCGGQHLNDWLAYTPVHDEQGRRVAIAGILVHHLDVGGGAAGSMDPSATEIYQEGIRIPPVRVVSQGVRNDALISTILQNSREPISVGGDFESQLAALAIGASNLRRVAARYGHETLANASRAIQAQSEAAMRVAIQKIPNGDYEFEDFVDGDGIVDQPVRIKVRLNVSGDEVTIDLQGTSEQTRGPVNCTLNMTSAAVICGVMMSIGSDIPANAGVYRAIHVLAPLGSAVNARSPAPVANRMAVGHRVVNTVMGAFASALPKQVPASYYGVSYAYALNCMNADGSRQVYFDLECGGWGGHPQADGASAFSCGFHNIANSPMEMIEQTYPITFNCYSLLPDTGGEGKFRGGLGLAREFTLNAPAGEFAANFDRFKIPPYGLDGGAPGKAGHLKVQHGDGPWQDLESKVAEVALQCGDSIRVETAGGGGYGNAAERDKQAIEIDREQGYTQA